MLTGLPNPVKPGLVGAPLSTEVARRHPSHDHCPMLDQWLEEYDRTNCKVS